MQDRFHAISQPFLDTRIWAGVVMVVPTLFLAEVSAAVARQTTPADGLRTRAQLLKLDLLRWIPVDLDLAQASAQLAADLQIRGADSIYVALAKHLSLPLISWNSDHRTRATQRITVYMPETAP